MIHYYYIIALGITIVLYIATLLFLKKSNIKKYLFLVFSNIILFSCWDIFGIVTHIWSTNPSFVTGIFLLYEYPIEEFFFLLSTSLFALTLYYVLETYV